MARTITPHFPPFKQSFTLPALTFSGAVVIEDPTNPPTVVETYNTSLDWTSNYFYPHENTLTVVDLHNNDQIQCDEKLRDPRSGQHRRVVYQQTRLLQPDRDITHKVYRSDGYLDYETRIVTGRISILFGCTFTLPAQIRQHILDDPTTSTQAVAIDSDITILATPSQNQSHVSYGLTLAGFPFSKKIIRRRYDNQGALTRETEEYLYVMAHAIPDDTIIADSGTVRYAKVNANTGRAGLYIHANVPSTSWTVWSSGSAYIGVQFAAQQYVQVGDQLDSLTEDNSAEMVKLTKQRSDLTDKMRSWIVEKELWKKYDKTDQEHGIQLAMDARIDKEEKTIRKRQEKEKR